MRRFLLVAGVCLFLSLPVSATTIADWNGLWFDAVRVTGGAPTPIARAGAMLNIAMYNAVNTTAGLYEPYHFNHALTPDALPEVAAAAAAHAVLVHVYGGNAALVAAFDAALSSQLALVPDGPAKTAGIALGQASALSIITLRTGDGSDVMMNDYVHGMNPGDWQETDPGFTAATPHWGAVTPFAVQSATQFDPGPPAGASSMSELLASQAYADALNQVKLLGQDVTAARSDEQTAIAAFWANDTDGTYKPPGHLAEIALTLSQLNGLNLLEESRLLALVSLAMADAGITAWYVKYDTDIDLWRPVTAIQNADLDGNPDTDADPTWKPLSEIVNGFTPPFPAYTSGHATFGASVSAVFRNFFGTDLMDFTIGTDDPYYLNVLGLGPRTYHSFTDIAHENGQSRIYLGVHYEFDFLMGYDSGGGIGDYVFANYLRPIPEPVTLAGAALALSALALHLRRRRCA